MTDCIATVGTFDGFHAGHSVLLLDLVRLGKEHKLPTRLITFFNHPLEVIAPERKPPLVRSRKDMQSIPLGFGVDRVSEMQFTPEIAAMTAKEFIQLIRDRYGVKVLLVGFNNHIGCDRVGDEDRLNEIGRELGVEMIFEPGLKLEDDTVPSSSLVRKAVSEGNMDLAHHVLVNYFELDGMVHSGRRLGHKLGFPTVNLSPVPGVIIPKEGVYVGAINIDGITYSSVINVGRNPTVCDSNPVTIEAHSIDGPVFLDEGDEISFIFYSRLRDEMKFAGLPELKSAISSDVKAAKSWLKKHYKEINGEI